jgi:pimeloyl-ACP methyl ester carboxylesterase
MNTRFAALLVLTTGLQSLDIHVSAQERDSKPLKKFIRAEDAVRIACEVSGRGDTALIFLHGWCGDREYWKHQVDSFAADYQVVAIDQAGHGESGKDREHWSVSSLAGDVTTVVDALNLKRVILVGHSMGGPVSLMAAQRMPGKVVGVIGVDTLQNAEVKMRAELVQQLVASF